MEQARKKVAFPRYAEYNCGLRYLMEKGLDVQCILPPKLTKRTMELGAQNSPDFVCTPFKTLLGNQIEALEAGADTLVMTYGLCKLGYFGELEKRILRDMGYQFDFVDLSDYNTGKKKDMLRALRAINPKVKPARFFLALAEAVRMTEYVDEITGDYYRNRAFVRDKKAYDGIYRHFLTAMYAAESRHDIEEGYHKAKLELAGAPMDRPENPLRVGIVGEFYTAMDEFSNLEVEKKLTDLGVEVHRWMTVTNRMLRYPGDNNLQVQIKDYVSYSMGCNTTANSWAALDYVKRGFDGVIHIKSANCTPETDAMTVLNNISSDSQVPFLYLTFDVQTSDVGLQTRLEAFYDMLAMRKKVLR
ncbi:MAG: hypothetical protein MJ075_03570 [Oscillospiraceae bacterium]|nr:hypothetical protein [Oscillospiraceae bacterium]